MFKVTSFYNFFLIKEKHLSSCRKQLLSQFQFLDLRGLVIIGKEGINATLSGKENSIEESKTFLKNFFKQDFFWKDSYCKIWNFRRMSVKIKKEIISIGKNYLNLKERNNYLTPKEWEQKMTEDIQILDVRNKYETAIGKFQRALELNLKSFRDFPKNLDEAKLNKNKETLIYCTGGIRCEKAIEVMKEKKFKKVYQLEGGVLNYLKEYPDGYFKKDCFVFDRRVALNQKLEVSKNYFLCPHCGQPGRVSISCRQCQDQAVVCQNCLESCFYYETCSKNCAYHFKKSHKCHNKKHLKSDLDYSI